MILLVDFSDEKSIIRMFINRSVEKHILDRYDRLADGRLFIDESTSRGSRSFMRISTREFHTIHSINKTPMKISPSV